MAADPGAPFARVGIVGLGLIGGSIGLRIRATWPNVSVIGVDDPSIAEQAARRNAITERRRSLPDLADVDLIILATPVPVILTHIETAAAAGLQAVITDVGSTKRAIVEKARRAQLWNFIGGHPVAGSERVGLEHAQPDLFDGRPWLLVDAEAGSPAATALERFAAGLGAVPGYIDAVAHDRTMAYVSHVPQLLAVALMSTAAEACGEAAAAASGPAFREMTRLASSPPDLWRGILATNADFVAEATRALVDRLPRSADRLESAEVIDELFAHARRARERLEQIQRQKAQGTRQK